MPNRLASESSPYLRQHAGNPVDWYPWGSEAFERARREEKPILLSVGYAACHWCHVMEHESFEDRSTADLMNEHFVSVKVDREERPDVDQIYMQAVQAMTGHGGWPMTVFLTPDGHPFYGGTYFPPEDRHGMPSFKRLLAAITDAWRTKREQIDKTTQELGRLYALGVEPMRSSGPLNASLLERAWRGLAQQHDSRHGGFGAAPKFPSSMALDFLLRFARRTGTEPALDIVRNSFTHMAEGGIYDQLGGGFHRYAVDEKWLVPHFEKMLYDNALLARLAVHLWQMTGDALPRRIAEETIEWVRREMTSPEGGFYATLDADSEGEEGRYYVFAASEIEESAGDDAPIAKAYWGITAEGNFEGRNILSVVAPIGVAAARTGTSEEHVRAALERARFALLERRERRVRPGRDEKVIASWNGLMLRAVCDAARAFDRPDLSALARRNAEFLFGSLVSGGRVRRSWMDGTAKGAGYLEDHAAIGLAALAMYELTFETQWLDHASQLAHACVEWFFDEEVGAFFDTAKDHEQLIARPREFTDNATPSGTSLAIELLLRAGELTGDADLRRRATWVVETLAEPMARFPMAMGHALGVADLAIHGAVELAIVGDPEDRAFHALAAEAATHYLPGLVLAAGHPAPEPLLLRDRSLKEGRATAYVCRGYSCDEPATDPAALGEQLERAVRITAAPVSG